MCGISGVISFNENYFLDQDKFKSSADFLKFRGPDQEGYFIQEDKLPKVYFAHKRLSIIDLSENGRQPMKSVSGRTIIVFNGEIYNYKELKQYIDSSRLNSNSDTEIIIALYEKFGIEKTLDLLEGMFAFALYDKVKNDFILARDRFGEKPLFYSLDANTLAFSSDIRSFKYYSKKLTLDTYSLGYYFQEMSSPEGKSIWNEVKKLKAAHFIRFSHEQFKIENFWELHYNKKGDYALPDIIDKGDELIQKSVSKRLVADVPVGCFLSGGVDSGLITAIAAQQSSNRINTFSVGFDYEAFNELPYAKKVAEKYNTIHHEIVMQPYNMDIIDALIDEYGEPFADSSMIPSYYISKFAGEQMKVVMGGDGGDEIFAGYNTYKQGYRMQKLQQEWSWLLPFIRQIVNKNGASKISRLRNILEQNPSVIAKELYRSMGFNTVQMFELFNGNKVVCNSMEEEYLKIIEESDKYCNTTFDKLLYGSIKTRLVNDYLVKVDRASMFNSLEVRVPFLERNLVEYFATVKWNDIMKDNQPKYIIKEIAKRYIPHENIFRKKQGFGIPLVEWFRTDLKKHLEEVLFESKQNLVDINYSFLRKIFDEHQKGIDHSHRLYIAYVFHKWALKN
jgi:asparagine synthase (glutamine-hydrolysing)